MTSHKSIIEILKTLNVKFPLYQIFAIFTPVCWYPSIKNYIIDIEKSDNEIDRLIMTDAMLLFSTLAFSRFFNYKTHLRFIHFALLQCLTFFLLHMS